MAGELKDISAQAVQCSKLSKAEQNTVKQCMWLAEKTSVLLIER